MSHILTPSIKYELIPENYINFVIFLLLSIMVRSCSAINCSVRDTAANKAIGITFHRFPKDIFKRRRWALATRREGSTKGSAWHPTNHAVLCSKHFLEKDFEVTQSTRRLRENVVPSVFEFGRHAIKKSKSKDPIIIHTRNGKNVAESPTTNLPHPITQNNESTTNCSTTNLPGLIIIPTQDNKNAAVPPTTNLPHPITQNHSTTNLTGLIIIPTQNNKNAAVPPTTTLLHPITQNNENTTNGSTTNLSGLIIIPTQNTEIEDVPPTTNLSEPSYSVQEDEVQFLKNKLKSTNVKYEEGCEKLCTAQKEISEQNKMICELLNDLVSLKKGEVKLLKRNLEKTEAKYENVCENLRIAQKEISEQNEMIHELLNELASLKMKGESD